MANCLINRKSNLKFNHVNVLSPPTDFFPNTGWTINSTKGRYYLFVGSKASGQTFNEVTGLDMIISYFRQVPNASATPMSLAFGRATGNQVKVNGQTTSGSFACLGSGYEIW